MFCQVGGSGVSRTNFAGAGCNSGTTEILTDTPEKDAIGEEDMRRNKSHNQRGQNSSRQPKKEKTPKHRPVARIFESGGGGVYFMNCGPGPWPNSRVRKLTFLDLFCLIWGVRSSDPLTSLPQPTGLKDQEKTMTTKER